MLSAWPGVALLCQVVSGTGDLAEQAIQLLGQCDATLGLGAVGRLTIVDAECGELSIVRRFVEDPQRDLVTVLKGPLARGKVVEARGQWEPYRQRDQVREVEVELEPGQAQGLRVRGVEMRRPTSRRPQTTCFLSTADQQALPTASVADAYLSRWPCQEDIFRRGRNGLGFNRTSGLGVSPVTNVAVLEKREAAWHRLERATVELTEASERQTKAKAQLTATQERLAQRRASPGGRRLDGRSKLGVRQATARLKERTRAVRQARQKRAQAAKQHAELASTPSEIFVRDTALDTITTCLKMVLLCLLEFICQEFLGGRRFMPRTMIEAWMALPVTMRRSRHRVVYEVAPNPRDPAMTELLGSALAKVTARELRVDGRLLEARLRPDLPRPNSS